jgi:2-polyprenyl-6-methoxyphenol hydroxylase-like FAD-dependent oxidoreductase
LVKYTINQGWNVRFDTSFIRYERDAPDGPITSTIQDNLTGQTYTIRSKYLFGCDGARSQIVRQLQIPLFKKPVQGLALNVLVQADLSRYLNNRTGNLHWIFTPEIEHPPWGWTCILRMVKPWRGVFPKLTSLMSR